MPASHIYLYSLSHIERLQLQLPLAVSRLSIIVALWERFGLMNQSKISVDIGSFSVPAVLRLFSAQIPTVQRNRSSVLLNFLDWRSVLTFPTVVTCSESQNLSHLKTYLTHRTFKNLPTSLKTQDDCCPIYIQDMEKLIGEFRYGKNLDTGRTPYTSSGYKR